MRRQALIAALLIVGVAVVLGATVFRTDIAQATGLASAVTVNNTASNPVPVREQNLDGGNIKVHEQGTATVATAVATRHFVDNYDVPGTTQGDSPFPEMKVSLIAIHVVDGPITFSFQHSGTTILEFNDIASGSDIVLPLPQPVALTDTINFCNAPGGLSGRCHAKINFIGS